jgi:hypothetical protein
MGIIKTFESFHAFDMKNEKLGVEGLSKFKGQKLLGGYISDAFVNNAASVGVMITDTPDTKPNDTDNKILFWINDYFWQLDGLRDKKTDKDEELLAEMAKVIDASVQ